MRLFLGAVLAAVLSFGWGMLSWQVLDWRQNGIHGFSQESEVGAMIKKSAPDGSGIYVLPHLNRPSDMALPDEIAASQAAYDKAMSEGPYVYAIVRPGRAQWDRPTQLIYSFVRSLLCCIILGMLLKATTIPYAARIAFVAAAGLFAGLAVDAPMYVWFEMAGRDLGVAIADHVIEWSLAGAVLGLFCGKEPTFQDGF
ncbi:MAG: hypothetical protein KDK97_15195 [Verrucomicrobiales bacterium]|nr:hypothetical protein [Verrucomicrobiales bacterium]MCP5559157.1 hypothetical protein [Verrucomicrobiaceae bacterium]